jgi:hypothetical protein
VAPAGAARLFGFIGGGPLFLHVAETFLRFLLS